MARPSEANRRRASVEMLNERKFECAVEAHEAYDRGGEEWTSLDQWQYKGKDAFLYVSTEKLEAMGKGEWEGEGLHSPRAELEAIEQAQAEEEKAEQEKAEKEKLEKGQAEENV